MELLHRAVLFLLVVALRRAAFDYQYKFFFFPSGCFRSAAIGTSSLLICQSSSLTYANARRTTQSKWIEAKRKIKQKDENFITYRRGRLFSNLNPNLNLTRLLLLGDDPHKPFDRSHPLMMLAIVP